MEDSKLDHVLTRLGQPIKQTECKHESMSCGCERMIFVKSACFTEPSPTKKHSDLTHSSKKCSGTWCQAEICDAKSRYSFLKTRNLLCQVQRAVVQQIRAGHHMACQGCCLLFVSLSASLLSDIFLSVCAMLWFSRRAYDAAAG